MVHIRRVRGRRDYALSTLTHYELYERREGSKEERWKKEWGEDL